jgi:hypothetical protein
MEKPRLIQQVSNPIRLKHYSLKTEKSYIRWIKRYIKFNNYTALDFWHATLGVCCQIAIRGYLAKIASSIYLNEK